MLFAGLLQAQAQCLQLGIWLAGLVNRDVALMATLQLITGQSVVRSVVQRAQTRRGMQRTGVQKWIRTNRLLRSSNTTAAQPLQTLQWNISQLTARALALPAMAAAPRIIS